MVLRIKLFFMRFFGNLNINVRLSLYHPGRWYAIFHPFGWRFSGREGPLRYCGTAHLCFLSRTGQQAMQHKTQ